MSRLRNALIAPSALLWLVGVAAVVPVQAQIVDPDPSHLRLGPLALQPAIRITNVGVDDNVFNDSEDNHPTSDVTATASPVFEAWLRTRRVKAYARGQYDFFYYKDLHDLRTIDTDTSARVELMLNRFTPFIEGSVVNAGHHNGYEIDIFARRHDKGTKVGVDVRLTPKVALGAYTSRSHSDYDLNSLYRNTDLAFALNHDGGLEGAGIRYSATPLTTFAVYVEEQRDRFQFSADRNTDSQRVMPTVEFKPLALISGRAAVGFRKVIFLQGNTPDFSGVVAAVDLNYILRARTQFSVSVRRDLDYSYLDQQHDYVITGFSTTVTQKFTSAWDLRGSVGRYRLDYQQRVKTLTNELPREINVTLGAELGYQFGRTRIGVNVDHGQRDSDAGVGRGYERLRVASSLTYAFYTHR